MPPKPTIPELAVKAGLSAGVVPFGGALGVIIYGLRDRRDSIAEQSLGAIASRVGEDAMMSILERDPELEALLWNALQAIVATGYEPKREIMRRVVAQAFISDEPIDEEQLLVAALAELDAPHVRALARLASAGEGKPRVHVIVGHPDQYLQDAADREPAPVIAALIRTGVLLPGPPKTAATADGRPAVPEGISVVAISDFGRRLLADLRDADPRP